MDDWEVQDRKMRVRRYAARAQYLNHVAKEQGFMGFLPPEKVPQGWDRKYARSRGIIARDRLPTSPENDPLPAGWNEEWGDLPYHRAGRAGYSRDERELMSDQADALDTLLPEGFSLWDREKWEKS